MARADEPAFPTMDAKELDRCPVLVSPGLSVREWYAGQALPAVIAQWERYFRHNEDGEGPSITDYARDAFRIADAMLAESEMKKPAKRHGSRAQ